MDTEITEENAEKRALYTEDEVELKMRKVKERIEKSLNTSESGNDGKAPPPSNLMRKMGSWIFESVGGYYLPTENVSKLSVKMQEQLLIRDLIYAFSGVPSSHIRPDISIDDVNQLKTDQIGQVRFKIDENFSGAFRSLANELLPLIGYYINVQSFIEDTIMTTSCCRSLGVALHRNMQQYFEVQSALESQLQEQKLNLQQLVHQLRPWLITMEAYASLTSRARCSDLSTADLLSLMHEHQQHFKTEGLKKLITDVSHYYMKMVQLWTQKGVLYDVRGDFFIEDTRANAMSSTLLSPKQCCHSYWAQRYRLHMDRLPSFLEPVHERIFLAGKYLNVLRQCNAHMKLMQIPLSYLPGDEAHVEFIRSSYELPARKLLEILVENQQLMRHLQNLQGYFLLQQENFTKSLMEKCAGQLQYNVDCLIPEKMQKLLLEALQSSDDPFKHMLHCQLMDCDVATQLANRHKRHSEEKDKEMEMELENEPSSEMEASSEVESSSELPEPLSICGFEAFTLRYTPNWPISLVIHDEPLEQLQLLHRVLFFLRYVQHQLKSTYYDLSKCNSHAAALRDRMTECILQLEQHMLLDIVEPHWQSLLLAVERAELIDEVLSQFQDTLDQCLLLCLLSEPITFVRSLYTLGQLCLNYCGFIEQPTSEEFESGVVEYEEEFNSLLLSILDLVVELSKPNSASSEEERESCKQLLQRLKFISKDLAQTPILSEI
ncbi:gamma-tubulin complex component 2 homolog [Drosophila innubila]|uniref:gamma-tubulin complex component 2 homolog n=1 Tax=Drosophila innubila TaxID=198719 RepID=UPI00148BBEBF|nr:gamma-tubulin complex component 2 homolog [Drosophila innubila]